jgi:hypothetical protein
MRLFGQFQKVNSANFAMTEFSEDEMRRPIPRAVPCVRVCNMYELHIGSTEGGIGP